jgi:hypothetical protein
MRERGLHDGGGVELTPSPRPTRRARPRAFPGAAAPRARRVVAAEAAGGGPGGGRPAAMCPARLTAAAAATHGRRGS